MAASDRQPYAQITLRHPHARAPDRLDSAQGLDTQGGARDQSDDDHQAPAPGEGADDDPSELGQLTGKTPYDEHLAPRQTSGERPGPHGITLPGAQLPWRAAHRNGGERSHIAGDPYPVARKQAVETDVTRVAPEFLIDSRRQVLRRRLAHCGSLDHEDLVRLSAKITGGLGIDEPQHADQYGGEHRPVNEGLPEARGSPEFTDRHVCNTRPPGLS